jgi:hypothetical protein
MPSEPEDSPRLVRKVVVGYDLVALPPALIRCFMLLRSKIQRAGWQVEVGLRPLSELPPDTDVLFVSKSLVDAARRALPQAEILPLDLARSQQASFDEFLRQLAAAERLCAGRLQPAEEQAESQRPPRVRYQGNTRIF